MEFPRLVYRCPGPHARPGGTYGHLAVEDEAALADSLAAGWFETVPEAIAGKANAAEAPVTSGPPTRAELEQMAAEIGIKVDGRWSDARLSSEVDKKLKE